MKKGVKIIIVFTVIVVSAFLWGFAVEQILFLIFGKQLVPILLIGIPVSVIGGIYISKTLFK